MFYFNGREIYRTNITNNPVIYDHLADDNVGTAPYFGPVTILVTNMFPGDNVLAVEVHQATLTSSDLAFAASFRLTMPSVVLPPCEPPQVAPETQVLSIRPYGALISIAWPTPGPILQQTTNLARPVVWEDVPGHPASPVLFTPDAPRSFYRLLQPP